MKSCHILEMLRAQKRHVSFHTPGHKRAGADICELSYSDNLYSPSGVIARAQRDAAQILGAEKSFFLTDGSTSGVHAMLWALRLAGCSSIAFPACAHVSVKNGCRIAGLRAEEIPVREEAGIPLQPTKEEIKRALERADALLLTSPDYYGNFPPLERAREWCDKAQKPLVIDGAHGSHLHFCASYAGRFADMWVDGLHKSLPALTQGAIVSAKTENWARLLEEGVLVFRTTSPSYPVLASVEYAVKYPRNEKIEKLARAFKREHGAYPNEDWSKILIPFGRECAAAQRVLEAHGVYPEFNDGNYLMFYLSPCTRVGELKKLGRLIKKLPRGKVQNAGGMSEEKDEIAAWSSQNTSEEKENGAGGMSEVKERAAAWVPLAAAAGRVCARECGIFPPCVPLLKEGEIITEEKLSRLFKAKNTFGLRDGKILVFKEKA